MSEIFKVTGQEDEYIKRLILETSARQDFEIINFNGIDVSIAPTTFSPCANSTHLIVMMTKYLP